MGILDNIRSVFQQKKQFQTPKSSVITITHSFLPLRLKANTQDKTTLTVNLDLVSDFSAMCSLVITLQNGLSFDMTNLNRKKELRLGMLEPNTRKTVEVDIYSTVNTPANSYQIKLVANVHDNSYSKIIRSFEKVIEIRVV